MAKQPCVYFFFLSHLSQLISLISLFSSLSLSDISSSLCLLRSFPWEYNIPSLGILLELPLEYNIPSLGMLLEIPLGIPYLIPWNTLGISSWNTISHLMEYRWNLPWKYNVLSFGVPLEYTWNFLLEYYFISLQVFSFLRSISENKISCFLTYPWNFPWITFGTFSWNTMTIHRDYSWNFS